MKIPKTIVLEDGNTVQFLSNEVRFDRGLGTLRTKDAETLRAAFEDWLKDRQPTEPVGKGLLVIDLS